MERRIRRQGVPPPMTPPRTAGGTKRIRASSNYEDEDIALSTPITPSTTVGSASMTSPSPSKKMRTWTPSTSVRSASITPSPSPAKRRKRTPSTTATSASPSKRQKWTQLSLDVGQRDVASRRCAECGMVYAAGVDDSEHEKYHRKGKNGGRDKLVRFTKASAKGGQPAHVIRDTFYYVLREINKVVRGVHTMATKELGGNAQGIGDDKSGCGSFVLAVRDSHVVGYCMFERISSANIMGIRGDADFAVFDCRKSVQEKTLLGIRYLWVAKQHRRAGIANDLIDTARKFGTYGHVFQRNKIAFTPPTRAGAQFALSYAPLRVRVRAPSSKTRDEVKAKEKGSAETAKDEKCDAKKDVAGYIFVYRASNTLTTVRE